MFSPLRYSFYYDIHSLTHIHLVMVHVYVLFSKCFIISYTKYSLRHRIDVNSVWVRCKAFCSNIITIFMMMCIFLQFLIDQLIFHTSCAKCHFSQEIAQTSYYKRNVSTDNSVLSSLNNLSVFS